MGVLKNKINREINVWFYFFLINDFYESPQAWMTCAIAQEIDLNKRSRGPCQHFRCFSVRKFLSGFFTFKNSIQSKYFICLLYSVERSNQRLYIYVYFCIWRVYLFLIAIKLKMIEQSNLLGNRLIKNALFLRNQKVQKDIMRRFLIWF